MQKISKTLNHLSIFDLFEKNISNFIVLFNFDFFFEIIQRNIQNKLFSIFIFNTMLSIWNFVFEFFFINKLNLKKRREFLFENFITKFRKFLFEIQQFVI